MIWKNRDFWHVFQFLVEQLCCHMHEIGLVQTFFSMPHLKKRAVIASKCHSNGSRGFAPVPVPISHADVIDPDYQPITSNSDLSDNSSNLDSDSDSSPADTLKAYHSKQHKKERPSKPGQSLWGVYTKTPRTMCWWEEKKKEELREEIRCLNIPSISTFFQSVSRKQP